MKLKKVLSSVIAAAMLATSTAIVMPLEASAETVQSAVDKPDGFEEILEAFSFSGDNENIAQYGGVWAQLYGLSDDMFSDEQYYVKVTFTTTDVLLFGDTKTPMGEVAGWGWSSYSGWLNAGKFYDGTVKNKDKNEKDELLAEELKPAKTSTNKSYYCYLPISAFETDDHIAGNVQNYLAAPATISVELVKIDDTVPELPENGIAFDTDSGSVAAETYGQPAKTAVGANKTITNAMLKDDFIIVVPYTSEDRPIISFSDGKGETSPTNWVNTNACLAKNNIAYFTRADILSSWTGAGGKGDFSEVVAINVCATAKALEVSNVKFYSLAAPVTVESVTVKPATLELKVGDPASPLTATVAPEGAPQDVVWASSDTKVATVSTDGKVTAVASGVAEITATAKDTTIVGKCKVTVTNPATAITLNKTTLALKKGEADTLTATVTPTDADDEVEWTVAPSGVVTVDENGKVTAVKSGTATVTATAGTKSATCTVEVTNPATAIAIDETATVLVGANKTLAVTTTPEDADALTYTWTSSDTDIATVEDGVVTGVAAGTATITAKAGALTATCTVTVSAEAKPATAVTLNKTTLDLEVEGTGNLTATLTPADSTDSVTWTSSAPAVATVDKTGKVTAVAAGTATITATANATVKAECTVTVTAKTIAITGVTLDKTTASVEEGKTVELTATVKPADTTEDKTVTWTSSDTTVATVKDGVVTAVKAGKATITATAGTKSATCAVTVTAAAKPDEPTKPEQPTASDVLWEGNKSTGNWADYVQIEATELSEGDKIVVTLTPAANAQIALKNPTGNWDVLPGFAEIANQYGVVDITAGTSAFEYTLTAKDAEAISANGLVVGGQYYTVTKVERVAGTATAPTGYETGKVEVVSDYVPKTAGTQLIVRSITKAEAAQYESYTVTVTDSNGKKTTVTTSDCYKAFKYNTKDGAKTETAANGYFIIVKVTGVPAGTTVDIDIQPTK